MQLLQALNLLNETCAIRHYSLKTQKSYSHWLRRYSAFLKDPKFKLLSPEEKLEAFLTRLALSGISASSQNQAFNALLFFYRDVLNLQLGPVDSLRAHRPASLRYCPDRAEVFQLLAAVTNVGGYPTRLIVHLLYACGLRVCEPLNLRIKDSTSNNADSTSTSPNAVKAGSCSFLSAWPSLWNANWLWPKLRPSWIGPTTSR